MLIAIVICLLYIIGAMALYALDSWWNYPIEDKYYFPRNEKLIWSSIFWFVMIWYYVAWVIRTSLAKARENKFSKEKEENKVRVAAKREMDKLEAELEQEIQRKRSI